MRQLNLLNLQVLRLIRWHYKVVETFCQHTTSRGVGGGLLLHLVGGRKTSGLGFIVPELESSISV